MWRLKAAPNEAGEGWREWPCSPFSLTDQKVGRRRIGRGRGATSSSRQKERKRRSSSCVRSEIVSFFSGRERRGMEKRDFSPPFGAQDRQDVALFFLSGFLSPGI